MVEFRRNRKKPRKESIIRFIRLIFHSEESAGGFSGMHPFSACLCRRRHVTFIDCLYHRRRHVRKFERKRLSYNGIQGRGLLSKLLIDVCKEV